MPLEKNTFKIGTMVELTHPHTSYAIGEHNPATGSKYACIGTISNISDAFGNITVKWKNGKISTYITREISLANNEYNSIW